ncbi:hypothetical protein R1sor_017042 [Riccia sorocarpa]|uniref:Cytochrome P450 n=1 Tax=Riccia sorocarpa TaxID=122646 RepID=A0ABD3I9F3_9MARC
MATSWNGLSSVFNLAEENYVTLITALAFTVLWLLRSGLSYFRCRNRLPLPPGNFGFPFIGQTVEHLLAMRTADGVRQWMQNQVEKHGPLFRYRFVGYPIVMMSQPEGNKFIFQNEGTSNHMFWPSHMSTLIGPQCVITQGGERHKLVRRHLNRFFDRNAMSRHIHGVNRNAIRHFTNHWQGKEQLVALDMINLYSFSIICNLALSLEEGPLMDKIMEQFHPWSQGGYCLPINFPGFCYYKALKARGLICNLLDGLMKQRRRQIAEDHVPEALQKDILNRLLTVPDEEGNFHQDSFIKDNLLFLLFSGYDTSSSTLAMTIFYIAKNPHVYKQILQEHQLIVDGKRSNGEDENVMTMEDISAMKYTWGVIQETLRLHPAVTGTYRKTVTDLEYEGYHIPKGWLLNWNNQHSHYNPKYFKDPLKFDPSRWETRPPPFTYLPFGGGAHFCLGFEFSRMSMLIFIHHLVQNYSWSLVNSSYNGPFIRDPFPRTQDKVLISVKQLISSWMF